jgi:hypothetical protein
VLNFSDRPFRTQGCGIGRGLLQDAIRRTLVMAEQAGIRALLAHPIDEDATRFYLRFGFVVSPLREQQLLFLLKNARRLLLLTKIATSLCPPSPFVPTYLWTSCCFTLRCFKALRVQSGIAVPTFLKKRKV